MKVYKNIKTRLFSCFSILVFFNVFYVMLTFTFCLCFLTFILYHTQW
uniref:Uncharacterized protein n=1 Tax=Anguilla anguilla TaxID=7936 RepID=A0A0E9V8V7_ANGAN